MTNSNLPSRILENQLLTKDSSILVIGYNEALLNFLPDEYTTIDPSISKIKMAPSKHPKGSFQTQNLETFSLNRTFSKILSMNTLHLAKNLDRILQQIEKHLEEEAILYFPLAPNPLIEKFLLEEKWEEGQKAPPLFQKRSRTEVEDAVLAAPFESVMIEEVEEHQNFYSESMVIPYLIAQLSNLTNLTDDALHDCAAELKEVLYRGQNKDEVLTISSPWILLTLSNDLT